jgi:insulin-like growth factor-binding protein complex acid labile subunit
VPDDNKIRDSCESCKSKQLFVQAFKDVLHFIEYFLGNFTELMKKSLDLWNTPLFCIYKTIQRSTLNQLFLSVLLSLATFFVLSYFWISRFVSYRLLLFTFRCFSNRHFWIIPAYLLLMCVTSLHGVRIDCEFKIENLSSFGTLYSCNAQDLIITLKDEVVQGIDGHHIDGMTNMDVKMFYADDQTIRFLPDLQSFFPNLQAIKIVKSGIKELFPDDLRSFQDLEFCDFSNNEIESLEPDTLFSSNSKLKEILFDFNKIKHVAGNIFEPLSELVSLSIKNNECIDESWNGENEIQIAKIKLFETCPTKFDESSITNGFEMGSNEGSRNEYQISNTKVTTIRKISQAGDRGQWSINIFEENREFKDITCETLSDIFSKYFESDLFTCSIISQIIDFPGYKIKISPEEGAQVKALSFNDNKGTEFFPQNIAEVFPNLVELSAKNTYLESISGKLFEGLASLRRISLSHHDLTVIENGNFAGLEGLEALDLSEGNIRFIEEGGFSELKSLKSLNIGANKLKFLQAKTFDGLTQLQNISLELNHLTHLEDNLFSDNKHLVFIWLNGNKINALSPTLFDNLNELSHVDLTLNECVDNVYETSSFEEMKKVLEENCDSIYTITEIYTKIRVSGKQKKVRHEFNIEGTEDDSEIDRLAIQYFESSDVEIAEDDITTESATQAFEEDISTSPPQAQTLIIKNNPETKSVVCEFSEDIHWFYSDDKLKTCVIENQMIDSKEFSILPESPIEDVKAFTIANNQLVRFLPQEISEKFPNLLEFSARNSSLNFLSRKNFEGMSNLKSLNLANNNIKYIDSDALDDLIELEELDLSSNAMETLDESLFSKLRSLKTLRLSGNKIHFINGKMFRGLPNLQNISLSSNQLSTIDENMFKTNKNLKNIWLQNNKIKTLSPNMFNSLKNLEYVDFRNNKCIDSVNDNSNFEAMKADILGNCGDGKYVLKSKKKSETKKKPKKEKSKVEEDFKAVACDYEQSGNIFWPEMNQTFYTCVVNENEDVNGKKYKIFSNLEPYPLPLIEGDKIQALSFVNNKNMKYLPQNIGETFPNLIAMSFSGDSIVNISKKNFKNLNQLKSINLSGNKIKSFKPDTFEDLINLEQLILDNNEIEYIEETTFTYLKFLKKIKMVGNKLNNFNPKLFEGMTELQEISFDFDEDISEEWLKRFPKLKFSKVNGKVGIPDLNIDQETTDQEPIKTTDELKEISEVSCNFIEHFSLAANSDLMSCEIDSDFDIETQRFKIKPSPELSKVKRFNVKGNRKVKYLPENLAELMPNLFEVSVVDSGLLGVTRKNFDGLNQLKSINLSGNNIKHLEPDTFENLESLENLNLAENHMEFVEEDLFHTPKNLKKINLSDNKIHYIHPSTFKRSENLEEVFLNKNLLSVIEPSTFKQSSKLQNIDLSDNKIKTLSHKIFGEKDDLQTVNLLGNVCIDRTFDLQSFDEMTKTIKENCEKTTNEMNVEMTCEDDRCVVEDQSVENVEYSIKSPDNVEGTNVKSLTFVGPNIKYLPQNIGQVFPNLEEFSTVDTSLVLLTHENFQNLPKLKSLKLAGVEYFEPDTFENLISLEHLNINTDVDEIEDTFSKLVSLKTIYLKTRKVKPKMFEKMSELTDVEIDFEPTGSEETEEIETTITRVNPYLKRMKINGKVIKDNNEKESNGKVYCQFEDIDELTSGKKLLTCSFKNSIIDHPHLSIDYSPQVYRVTFENNQDVSFLPNNMAQAFPNLKEIIAKNSSLKPHIFKDLKTMKVLDLSNLQLNSTDILDLPNLEKLDLSHNSIHALNEDSFINLPSLKVLNLANNEISSINPKAFDNLQNLESINFQNNQNLPEIDQNILFKNNPELKSILVTNTINKMRKPKPDQRDRQSTMRMRNRTKPTTTKPTSRTSTKMAKTQSTLSREISCSFSDSYWQTINMNLYTCDWINSDIEDSNIRIKDSPNNHKVMGLNFFNNKGIKFLPQNFGKVS